MNSYLWDFQPKEQIMAENRKTNAKRMGVKAVLAHGTDKLTMTTFGNGNNAEIAFTEGNKGRGLCTPYPIGKRRFSVQNIDEEINLYGKCEGKPLESLLPNPAGKVGEDYLQFKDVLEKQFFGKSFQNDNIRIQIIYLILDIQKILGMTVSDILYTLGNLQDQAKDRFGCNLNDDRVAELVKEMRPYFGLFGGVFQIPSRNKPVQSTNHNENVLRCISSLRHATAHDRVDTFSWFKDTEYSKKIFKKGEGKGEWGVIEDLYKKKIETVNKDFSKNSKPNLDILFDLLHAEEAQKPEITQEYYRFSILKDGKNLGINLVKVRENIIDTFSRWLRNKKYDSQRQKINVIADFLIFRALNSDRDFVEDAVSRLRLTEDEKAKENLYHKFAEKVWPRVKNGLEPYFREPKTYILKYKSNGKGHVEEKWFASCKLQENGGNPFVKVLAFLCNFLEGKEINEFLTAYIHKFECIQAFIDMIHELNEEVVFTDRYALFNTKDFAKTVATELRVLASIGKMKPDLEEAKRLMYKYAIQTLGFPAGMEKYISDEWLEENVLLNAEDRKNRAKKAEVNPFRNFIAGNVIESRRFMYLVRYTKPATVHALMQNQKIVNYVLHRLPPDQIKSYARVFPQKFHETEATIQYLTEQLAQFSFETLIREKQAILDNSGQRRASEAIERLKAITGLYLSVAYIAIKNIVKANARYYIAFSIFERDLRLLKEKAKVENTKLEPPLIINGQKKDSPFTLTQYYIDRDEEKNYKGDFNDVAALHAHIRNTKRHFTKQWRDWLAEKIMEAKAVQNTGLLLSVARNQVEHLNVLRQMADYIADFRKGEQPMSSYFELFHYLLQRILLEKPEMNLAPYRDWILRSGRPDRDLIQYAFVSLAYNLARYRNLTKEHRFDEVVLERVREEKRENPEK